MGKFCLYFIVLNPSLLMAPFGTLEDRLIDDRDAALASATGTSHQGLYERKR